ncbi:hypothetical protein DFH06DRAFT_1150624 [Mycena polygramma]|nr:hypothetical protein DFH06DRAFT_1150624 [Mycena polygramma]
MDSPLIERTVLLYPWGTPIRQTASFYFRPNDATLRDLGILESNFYASPGRCDVCPKPHFRHAALPGVSFTLLIACPHHPDVVTATDDLWRLSPNKAVARLLPDTRKSHTCLGNLVVIKHAHPDGDLVANQGLPIIDMAEKDFAHVDELVRRLLPRTPCFNSSLGSGERHVARLLTTILATRQYHPVLLFIGPPYPSAILSSIDLFHTRLPLTMARLPLTMAGPGGDEVPCYDLDEIIANLTLEDEAALTRTTSTSPRRPPAPPATRLPPVRPETPPPRYSRRPPPNTPATRPAPSSSRAAIATPEPPTVTPPSTPPARCGETMHWSQAANATQGVPNSVVFGSPRAKRRGKRAVYVVFRGRTVGVMDTWYESAYALHRTTRTHPPFRRAEAEAATRGVRFSLHQGYSTETPAREAFQLAQANGWTSTSQTWSVVPLSSSLAPQPWGTASTPSTALCPREPSDPWYVVYSGVNPGIFGTSVECALNVLGIRSSYHEKFATYDEAVADFARATAEGEVHVRRARMNM